MSLNKFHVFFITISVLMTLGFGAWAMQEYNSGAEGVYLFTFMMSMLAAIGLGVYEWIFLQKQKAL